ncbi:DUF192 domain-containing protein [Halalkalicoccus jeotgali]|uniref:Uncharacterized ACR n=1 Tax=Halalkalicoccus jeotgali (strain DSM 18796 / CECT 7217 / JCM 14584 / KCTC 4019 / B3) TaxID=795797 RepID=D8J6Z3_HALJB|nr:DUF192 domain-containing protein [Halalkalicoccus jeotgali]ADJ15946.1 Uncharacterized ACR [Halalkalicoccus jeotgali B3]ELY38042.1 hypothetical protein C497_08029 [Halalkalicoccus jeotgali B3]
MRLVHRDLEIVVAEHVELADSFLARARGLMFRRSIPDDYALVFEFGKPVTRSLHMLCVPFPIDAVWLVDGEVTHTARLDAWTGLGRGWADTILELPAGAAEGIREGDRLELDEE